MELLRPGLLRRVIPVRSGEATSAMLMFAYSFLAMTAWNIVRPLTRSRFIDTLGSDNLPYVQLVAGVLIGLLMHLYGRAIGRVPRQRVIPATQAAIVALLVLFAFLLRTDAAWVSVAFYFLGLVLGILLISQFWTLANDVYDARQAKRLFGLIGAGSSLGGATGAQVTALVVERVGTDSMLLVAAAVLTACIGIVFAIGRRHAIGAHADFGDQEQGVGGGEAIKLLRQSRHLRVIALVVGCAAAGAWIVEQQLNMAAEASRGAGGETAIAAFLAQVNAYMSLAGFVVQLALTSVIHRSLGLTFALLLLPVSFAGTATVVLISGALWAPAVARGLDTTLRYTVDKTSRELLFLPLPAELKYRAKPFIDVTMDRFARAMAALVVLVLIKPWGLGLDWRRLSYASITITTLWIVVALVARRDYLASFRSSIGARSLRPEAIRTDVGDAATIEALVEELSSEDEDAVLYAIDVLEALEKPNLITPLLLHHDAPRVRARVLRAFSPTKSRGVARWQMAVERLVHDDDVDVRAAALRALAALAREDLAAVMRRHLDDPEPRVAVAAAAILADTAHQPDVALAEAALSRLVADTRDGSVIGRRETAAALAHIRSPRFRSLLVPLLDDHDVTVVREAIGSARRMGMPDGLFLPSLISLLGHRLLKAEARAALVGYGEDVIEALGHALRDPREHIWVRRHIPATLALLPTRASMQVLVAALADSDGFVRFKTIAALERLRRDHPEVACPRATLESLTVQETSRYYNYLTLRHNLSPLEPAHRESLLDRALDDKLARTVDRVYRLLGLLYGIDDVAAARFSIEQAEPRRRAAGIEYLDNVLGGTLRKRVLPLLESASLADRVRHANHVLKTRPRDVEDTLAQLVHEEDPAVAAAAIHFVARKGLWALEDDLQFVLQRRDSEDHMVVEAASWAIALRRRPVGTGDGSAASLPIVELADRLRGVAAFEFVSVEELFRLAEMGEEVRHSPNHELHHAGAVLDRVEILIEGTVRVGADDGGATEIQAPCALGVEDVLQSAPARASVRCVGPATSVRIRASDFMTIVSDNVLLAQGLFRMFLAPSGPGLSRPVDAMPTVETPWRERSGPVQPVDQALLLRQHPLLGRATATQLLELVGAARAVSLDRGRVLFSDEEPASLFLLLDGHVRLERDGYAPLDAGAGATVGVAETLAGVPSGWRASVTAGGRALRLGRQDLFAVLTDHIELMQGLFSGVLSLRDRQREPVRVGQPESGPVILVSSEALVVDMFEGSRPGPR